MLYLLYYDRDCPCGGWCWVGTPFGEDETRDYFCPIEDEDGIEPPTPAPMPPEPLPAHRTPGGHAL